MNLRFRNMTIKLPVLIVLIACYAINNVANAQLPASPASTASAPAAAASAPADPLLLAASEWINAAVVKNAPYCADAQQENTQTLLDGNVISRKFATRICRDSEGRSRQELERNGNRRVFINDVVARQVWMLNPDRRVAFRLNGFINPAPGAAAATTASAPVPTGNKLRQWARSLVGQGGAPGQEGQPPADATPVSPSTAEQVAIGEVRKDATVPVRRTEGVNGLGGGMQGLPPFAFLGGVQWQQRMAARGPGVVTALGSKEFEAAPAPVRAEGRLTTWTVPAGQVGNAKPLVSTAEVWISAELQLPVYTRSSDPRNGEASYRLVNLNRNPPSAELFVVPSGFVVRDVGR
jgi:hypothetical protein